MEDAMNLPFNATQFLQIFENYNNAVWPFQIILNLLALTAISLAFKKMKHRDKIISGILAFFWLWIGIVYHLVFFTTINKGAYLFGVLFIIQGVLFVFSGIVKDKLVFQFRFDANNIVGILLIFYALIIYPIIGHFFGHIYPQQPTFGLPCPTTIFTFGILLWTFKRVPKYVLIIPVLWSIIGFSAAINLGIKEDFGLLVAGLLGLILLIIRDRKATE